MSGPDGTIVDHGVGDEDRLQRLWSPHRMSYIATAPGTSDVSGVKNIASRNSTPVTMFAKPVRAPSAILRALSASLAGSSGVGGTAMPR